MSGETPLPGQQRCRCQRLCSGDWSFCPGCGRSLGDEEVGPDV